ncbi:MAG: YHYH domain-containing protein [Acidobacteria bacterium]|nr:YHYH domain-containing protein [Acidobacteriota bacterium]
MMFLRTAALICFLALTIVMAHPGRLNSSGCHNDRKNGGYHCHGGGSTSAPPRTPTPRSVTVPSPTATPSSITSPPEHSSFEPGNAALGASNESQIALGNAVETAENLLVALGYDPGPVDIHFDPATSEAIRQFQIDHGIAVDGAVTGHLLVSLSEHARESLAKAK